MASVCNLVNFTQWVWRCSISADGRPYQEGTYKYICSRYFNTVVNHVLDWTLSMGNQRKRKMLKKLRKNQSYQIQVIKTKILLCIFLLYAQNYLHMQCAFMSFIHLILHYYFLDLTAKQESRLHFTLNLRALTEISSG